MRVTVEKIHFVDKSKFPDEELTSDHVKIVDVGGFQAVVGAHYEEGQLCFIIQQGAIVPEPILEDMWLKGKLAGSKRNVAKKRKMHGVTSEVLVYGAYFFVGGNRVDSRNWNTNWILGQDITEELGVVFK